MASNPLAANATQADAMPPNMLDGIFPGFSLFRNIVLSHLGLDIGLIVTIAALVVGLGKAGGLVWTWLYENVISYFLTTIIVNDNDDLFESFKSWASDGVISQRSRTTVAVTPWQNLLLSYDYSTSRHASSPNKVSNDSELLFNFQDAQANSRLRNELHFDATWFIFHGRLYFVQREGRERPNTISQGRREEKQRFVLTCIGRSRKPLMDLLEHVRKESARSEEGVTKVVRPENRFGEGEWTTATTRTIRSLQSVIMEQEQKALVTRDLNTFIWPESACWYASRGIPYRRGYLFSGPPGTGKTSLAFALSGLFGLKLHVLSLTDKTITDSSLLTLFCNLPDRCIVLLEDVDAAGLGREGADKSSDESNDAADADDDEIIGYMTPEKEPSKSKVTLSGLLNAIDGVATHEGRVIIMTSNCPEDLDAALIRPGRIDEHIRFNQATHAQISELFLAMYSSNPEYSTDSLTLGTAIADIKNATSRVSDVPSYSMDDLRQMSEAFAARIPENTFSPAEVQGFLLPQERRSDPRAALEQIDFWVWKTQAEKENKNNDAKAAKPGLKQDKAVQTKDIEIVSASKASVVDLCDGESGVKTPETDGTAIEDVNGEVGQVGSGEVGKVGSGDMGTLGHGDVAKAIAKIIPGDTKIQEVDERGMVDKVEPEFAAGKISLDEVESGMAWSRPLSRRGSKGLVC